MRKVNSDNLWYGEVLINRLVWIDVKTTGMKADGEKSGDPREEYNHKATLQVTDWRLILTMLKGSVGSHKTYRDFSWSEIREVSSSGNWIILALKDESMVSIRDDNASLGAIQLWALGEAIKTEQRNGVQRGDVWEHSSSINFTCGTIVQHTGNWSLILGSYGISCEKGAKPKRLEWNNRLSIDIVNKAFARKNLEITSDSEKDYLQAGDTVGSSDDSANKDQETQSTRDMSDRMNDTDSRGYIQKEAGKSTKLHESSCRKPSAAEPHNKRSPSQQRILNEIKALIGLKEVKERVLDIVNLASINDERKKQGLSTTTLSLHMVFTGNPGTGKTTIARMLGKVFKSLGLLSKGHFTEIDRAGLVGGYLGQTAIKTTQVLESALGGVLFIDEAYSLSPGLDGDRFGQEAIDTILAFMENHRDDLVVIAAGYTDEMSTFIGSNPGLKSRFNTFIHFSDYSPDEMKKIFLHMAHSEQYIVHSICDAGLDEIFSRLSARSGKGFGNGREVRNIYEKTLLLQNRRLMTLDGLDRNRLVEILPCDLPLQPRVKSNSEIVFPCGNAQQTIDSLVGIYSVKQEIKKIVDMARVAKLRSEAGLPMVSTSLHMVFTGSPGTGKTTVARCLAQELYDLGMIARNQVIEVSRSELVAGYLGQTAIKTTKILDNAIGGILFIDEAYALNQECSSGVDAFGLEAIDALLKYMEDNKDSLMVIAAGYQQQMKRFLQSNPGLASRFNRYIHFEDYKDSELVCVFESMAKSSQYVIDKNSYGALNAAIAALRRLEGNNFSNARAVRNLFERSIEKQASRIVRIQSPSLDEIKLLIAEDIACC